MSPELEHTAATKFTPVCQAVCVAAASTNQECNSKFIKCIIPGNMHYIIFMYQSTLQSEMVPVDNISSTNGDLFVIGIYPP